MSNATIEKNETFQYTYSAKQQEEVRKIREKYTPKEANKMEQLRRLDASATKPGRIAALTLGIVGTIVLGVGMCFTMVWADTLFVPGVIVGVAGLAAVGAAFPLYRHMTKRKREKLAPEVLRLVEELEQNS
jgi:hypothetical protein